MNELYGSDTLSAFGIAERYSKSIDNSFLLTVMPFNLVRARDELKAKRKLTLMSKSNATCDSVTKAGDPFHVYVKHGKERKRKVAISLYYTVARQTF